MIDLVIWCKIKFLLIYLDIQKQWEVKLKDQ